MLSLEKEQVSKRVLKNAVCENALQGNKCQQVTDCSLGWAGRGSLTPNSIRGAAGFPRGSQEWLPHVLRLLLHKSSLCVPLPFDLILRSALPCLVSVVLAAAVQLHLFIPIC